MRPSKLCHCSVSSLLPLHRVGGPVRCSTASIGSRTLLGLQGIAPQGLMAWNDVCNVGGIQMGLALYEQHLSDRESNKSILTQMSYVLGEAVVGGVKNLLATKNCWQHSKWI